MTNEQKGRKIIKYRVFYNEDCAKWGVQRFGNLMNDCMGDRWQQICLKDEKKPAYTKYKGVAERWMKIIKEEVKL